MAPTSGWREELVNDVTWRTMSMRTKLIRRASIPPAHRHVVIIGASFAGLFAAAAMANAGAAVTVLERDRLTDCAEPRPGVPQGVQPHILLYRGLRPWRTCCPVSSRNVLDAGGLRLDTGKFPWLGPHGWSPTDLPSYDILSISRPVLELLVRRRVLEMPGVRLRDGFRVQSLGQSTDVWEVRGSTGETVHRRRGGRRLRPRFSIAALAGRAGLPGPRNRKAWRPSWATPPAATEGRIRRRSRPAW